MSLLLDFGRKQANVYFALVSLDSTEIQGMLNVTFSLLYTALTGSVVAQRQSASFWILVDPDSLSSADEPFYRTLGFFVPVVTGGLVLLCALLGLACYGGSKLMRKENFVEEEYYTRAHAPPGRLEAIEMTSRLDQSQATNPLSNRSKLQASKVMESLLHN